MRYRRIRQFAIVAMLVCALVFVAQGLDFYYPIRAVERIRPMGGAVTRDAKLPDHPVIGVSFSSSQRSGVRPTRFRDSHVFLLNAFKDTLTSIDFGDSSSISDLGLKQLHGFEHLTTLGLSRNLIIDRDTIFHSDRRSYTVAVSNEGLRELGRLRNLKSLDISFTSIKDEGIQQLRDCRKLTNLNLESTQITDAALSVLAELKNLTRLNVRNTQVTEIGLKRLKESLLQLAIE